MNIASLNTNAVTLAENLIEMDSFYMTQTSPQLQYLNTQTKTFGKFPDHSLFTELFSCWERFKLNRLVSELLAQAYNSHMICDPHSIDFSNLHVI